MLRWARDSGGYLFSDEIFGLVDLRANPPRPLVSAGALEGTIPGALGRTLLFTGVSKEFAAGGLRVGFVACRDADLLARIEARRLVGPDRPARRAAEHLFAAFRRGEGGLATDPAAAAEIERHLGEQRARLTVQRERLARALERLGFVVPETEGGLFLFPIARDAETARRLPERFVRAASLSVNGPAWSGSRDRLRLVFSLEPRRLDEALERLARLGSEL